MDDPQIIKTPSGDELVVLAKQDYEALLDALAEAEEELADIAVLDQRLAEMAANPVPHFPPEVSALMLRGDRRLAAIRKWRSHSVGELAAKSGVSTADIAAFEAGQREQNVEQAQLLANALNVHPGWLEP
jgi:DNA-binding XRE family transcriptional regulator